MNREKTKSFSILINLMKPITSRVNKISSFFDSFDESWRNAQLQTHQRERLSKILSEIDTKLTLKNASLNELFDIQDAGVRHTSDLITYLCVSRLAYNLDISYTICEKYVELFTSGQINDNYINDKPCVELCGEYKCKLCHDAVVRRRFQNEAKNIDTVVHYNCLLKIHPDDAEAISLNEIFPLFPSIEGLNEIRLGL